VLKRLFARLASIPRPSLKPVREFLSAHRAGVVAWGSRLGAVGAIALIVLLIHRSIYTYLTGQPAFRLKQQVARLDVTPRWADARTGEGQVNLRISADEWNLFNEDLVATIGRAFEQNAWVKKVTSVQRVFPDQVAVKFERRRPYAAIQRANGLYLIDRDGVRLPGLYVEAPSCESNVKFQGLGGTPPSPGQKWEGAEIAAVVEMAELIARQPVLAKANIAFVDLSNLDARLDKRRADIALITASGCSIEWGRVPSSTKVGEAPVAEKLASLRQALETYPNLQGCLAVKIAVTPKGQFPPTLPRETAVGKTVNRRP